MSPPSLPIRFSAYYGAVFLALGIYLPFWPLWLGQRGLSAGEIGLLLALATWVKVAAMPAIAQVADRSGRAGTTTAVLAAVSILSFAAFFLTGGFWSLLAVQVFAAASFYSLIPLGESQAMAAVLRRGLDYGRMRLWGSITFILGSLAAGALVTGYSPDVLLWVIIAALVATCLAACGLPEGDGAARSPGSGRRLRALVADRRFLLFLAAASLLQGSHAVYYGFSALHWRAAGHDGAVIGWLWAEGVIAEIVLFSMSGALLRRMGPTRLLAVAGLGGVLRWSLLGATTELGPLIAAQALHAATFGAAHLGAVHFIARAAPPGLSATAQGLYAAVSGGVATGLLMLLAGYIYEGYAGGAFLAMAVLSGLGMALAHLLGRMPGSGFAAADR